MGETDRSDLQRVGKNERETAFAKLYAASLVSEVALGEQHAEQNAVPTCQGCRLVGHICKGSTAEARPIRTQDQKQTQNHVLLYWHV